MRWTTVVQILYSNYPNPAGNHGVSFLVTVKVLDMDIPKLILDPQNETDMVAQMTARTRASSGNQLTDFSPGSPALALHEGQAYAIAELLWFLNQLPEATALEVLRLSGVTRSPGTSATGELAVLLRAPLSSAFTLPAGYQVTFKDKSYILQDILYIAPGGVEGKVQVSAAVVGRSHNTPAYGLVNTNPGLNYVQSIYNPEPITGGTDLEPLSETVSRAQVALRSRSVLVSQGDYETKAQELLGPGSKAWTIPLLASDRETEKAGHIHVFLLDASGVPPSTGTCQTVQGRLRELSFAGSSTWVSPVVLEEVSLDVTLAVDQISPELAQAIADNLSRYFDPFSFGLGQVVQVKELEYRARATPGVLYVNSVLIDGQSVDRRLLKPYHFPRLELATITMIDRNGYYNTYHLGTGIGDPF